MKFSMAEFWGMVTLLTFTFAGLRLLFSLPEAIAAVLIVAFPIHAIVSDLIQQMQGRAASKSRLR